VYLYPQKKKRCTSSAVVLISSPGPLESWPIIVSQHLQGIGKCLSAFNYDYVSFLKLFSSAHVCFTCSNYFWKEFDQTFHKTFECTLVWYFPKISYNI
jgi:hypothetical protein